MLKVSDLDYRTQNDFRFAIVSADDLEILALFDYVAIPDERFFFWGVVCCIGEPFSQPTSPIAYDACHLLFLRFCACLCVSAKLPLV